MKIHSTLRASLLVAAGVAAGRVLTVEPATSTAAMLSADFQKISARVGPAVVRIEPQARGRRGMTAMGQGSGFVIDAEEGLLLTNYHVVRNAAGLRVTFSDGRERDAHVVGTDPDADVALLRVDARGLTELEFATEETNIGEWVLAFGNPLGLGHSVTAGILSGKGRGNLGLTVYEDFLQTDAAINPGNSGGPLVDLEGRVVGINTAVVNAATGAHGIGFAIPAKQVRAITAELLATGRVSRGWLGVQMNELTEFGASELGYTGKSRVVVDRVVLGSPAQDGGVAIGDLIVHVAGKPVTSVRGMLDQIAEEEPGAEVKVGVWRDGKLRNLVVKLGERPDDVK